MLIQPRWLKCESVETPTISVLIALKSLILSLKAIISVGHTNVLKREHSLVNGLLLQIIILVTQLLSLQNIHLASILTTIITSRCIKFLCLPSSLHMIFLSFAPPIPVYASVHLFTNTWLPAYAWLVNALLYVQLDLTYFKSGARRLSTIICYNIFILSSTASSLYNSRRSQRNVCKTKKEFTLNWKWAKQSKLWRLRQFIYSALLNNKPIILTNRGGRKIRQDIFLYNLLNWFPWILDSLQLSHENQVLVVELGGDTTEHLKKSQILISLWMYCM